MEGEIIDELSAEGMLWNFWNIPFLKKQFLYGRKLLYRSFLPDDDILKVKKANEPPSSEEAAADNARELEELKRMEEERKRRDKERADRLRDEKKRGSQQKKSRQRCKSYNRHRDPTADVRSSSAEDESSGRAIEANANSSSKAGYVPRASMGDLSAQAEKDDASEFKKGLGKDPFNHNGPHLKLRKARANSIITYRKLTQKYHLRLVCRDCLVCVRLLSSVSKYELLEDPAHKCLRDHLAVRDKKSTTDSWSLIRNFEPKSKFLCQPHMTGQPCRLGYRCPYPHTVEESDVWSKFLFKQKPPEFVGDLSNSDLRGRIELTEYYCESLGAFHCFCAVCHENNANLVGKKKHVPSCDRGHPWAAKLFCGTHEVHKADAECGHRPCVLFHKLSEFGFSEQEIVYLAEGIKKSLNSEKRRSIKSSAFTYDEMKNEEDRYYCKPPVALEDAYDCEKCVTAMISFPYCSQEDGSQMRDEYEENIKTNIGTSQDPYYRMYLGEELRELMRLFGQVFKRCRFHLKGTNRAVCDFLNVDSKNKVTSVEIRGRQNCGPCFDGDEVVVELKDTKELGDDGIVVQRGTVVGILNHAFNRREYTFLCKMDPHVNHLMIPVNGVGPKLHVLREKSNFDHKNMVFIYEMSSNNEVQLKKSCFLSTEEKEATLFVIKYLQWEFGYMYPLGYVCALLKAGTTIEETQMILDVMYQIPCNYDVDTAADTESDEGKVLTSEEDLTHLLTISIDPENSRDIDDAISIVESPDGLCTVIVHIADVARYVKVDDWCDREASRRMMSCYPASGQVRSMLPKKLSDDLCSLLEGKKRWVLSVYFDCDESGKVITDRQPTIKETLIENKRQFSYSQVQRILDAKRSDGELDSMLQFLFSSSRVLRRQRLEMGWMFNEPDHPFESYQCAEAHQIIEEFMILTNITVAKFVMNKFPNFVPLRSQHQPNEEKEEAWIKEWSFLAKGSVYFDSFFDCDHINGSDSLTFLKSTITKVQDCLHRQDDVRKAIKLIGNESKHPTHAVALMTWYSIQEKAFYVCSGDGDVDEKSHFGLRSPAYTQFTSPIRRFLDLVVHRLVKAALKSEDPPYSTLDVITLCNKANIISTERRKYDREVNLTKLVKFLEKPMYVPIFASHLEEGQTDFVSPFLPKLRSRYRHVKHNQLALSDKPDVSKTQRSLRLMWDKKVFDANVKDDFELPHAREDANKEMSIDPLRHVYKVDATLWRAFLMALNEGDPEKIKRTWNEVKVNMNVWMKCRMGVPEITSEMKGNGTMVRPQVKFSLDVKKGSVLAVQLGCGTYDGYLRPEIKMLNLTGQLDICFCHKRDPAACFVDAPKLFTPERYANVDEYLKAWASILSMEAASTAIDSGDSIVCHNVPVELQRENNCYFGSLELGTTFCQKRKINVDVPEANSYATGDFLCLRFPLEDEAGESHSLISNKWLCHAVFIHDTKSAQKKRRGSKPQEHLKFSFKVQKFDCPPPEQVFSAPSKCTVEFLFRPVPEKKMSESLAELANSSELCRTIALGHSSEHLTDSLDAPAYNKSKTFNIDCGNNFFFYENNASQNEAIRRALTQPFTLIQGPPGTGKTVTGIKIAWWFAQANTGTGRKVMYCGPSNSSVDVAAEWLRRLGEVCPRIIRVYGKTWERQWYPLPRYSSTMMSNRRGDNVHDSTRFTRDLHHLIRQLGKPFASKIKEYDKKFRMNLDTPEKIKDGEVEAYEKLLDRASHEELQNYDIILCTCTASSTSRLLESNVSQLIIDECGMCKEPESLIPMITHGGIQQVVLIGDHKQLQPIVKNKIASSLGLKRSLFERYKEEAFMLNCQYRMHKQICNFPSMHFYDGKLKTCSNREVIFWFGEFWPDKRFPHLFCHVEGAEKSAIVSTSEGNEASKSNEIEAKEALRIYRELQYMQPRATICILSQYGAQCSLISMELVESGDTRCKVSTVVSSQGNEYDYVILSLVRSMPEYEIEPSPSQGWCNKNLGFITDEHQINVALTRAKYGLIIIGNKHLLKCNELFCSLLKDYNSKGCVVDCEDFAPSSNRFGQQYCGDKYGDPNPEVPPQRPQYEQQGRSFRPHYPEQGRFSRQHQAGQERFRGHQGRFARPPSAQ